MQYKVDRTGLLLQESIQQSVVATAQELAEYNSADLSVAKELRSRVLERLQNNNKLSVSDIRQLAATVEAAQRIARCALGATPNNEVPVREPESEPDFKCARRCRI